MNRLSLSRSLHLALIKNKKLNKITYRLADFITQADHFVKIKETEKKHKYLNFAREPKRLRNMTVTVIPIVTSALGLVSKSFERGIRTI